MGCHFLWQGNLQQILASPALQVEYFTAEPLERPQLQPDLDLIHCGKALVLSIIGTGQHKVVPPYLLMVKVQQKDAVEHRLSKYRPAPFSTGKETARNANSWTHPRPTVSKWGWGLKIWGLLSTLGDSDDAQAWEPLLGVTEKKSIVCYPWWSLSESKLQVLLLFSDSEVFWEHLQGWIYICALEGITHPFQSWAHYAQGSAVPGQAAPVYTYLKEQH